jgi:hypothetical protein
MLTSTKRSVLLFVAVVGPGLPFAYFFASPLKFWTLAVMASLTVVVWSILAVAHCANQARFGVRMTFDEIVSEKDPIRMVQLIRYHLGWTPGKIVEELNSQDIRNHGRPWREEEVKQAIQGVRRVF